MPSKYPFRLNPLVAAISAVLAPPATVIAQETEDEEEARDLVEEIIVTARKRDENLQDVPSSVQAIREDMLKQIGALHIEDYARLIPSMTWIEFSQAGNNYISFRGITTGTDDFVAQASASVYLDEVSVTQTGSQPNVRTMDINRVEALSGPRARSTAPPPRPGPCASTAISRMRPGSNPASTRISAAARRVR